MVTSDSVFSARNALFVMITSLLIAVGCSSSIFAQDRGDLCRGAELTFKQNVDCGTNSEGVAYNPETNPAPQSRLNSLLTNIINIFSIVVGIVAVIMIIVGGFKFITSGGDSAKVTSSRNTIIYAIIGLIIVALAQTIAKFVLGKVT